jgi:hypothetical protein
MMRSKLIAFGLLAGAVLAATPTAMQRTARPSRQVGTIHGRRAMAGEVLVKFRRLLASRERVQVEQEIDADQSSTIGRAGARRLHSRRFDTSTLVAFLRNHPDVEYVEPNYIVQSDAIPTDPFFGQLWGLLNVGQTVGTPGTPGADISATLAWDVSTGSRANVIAVIDTGIDYAHSDLAANVWSAPAPFSVTIGGQTITCAAGTHGFNAITRTCDPRDDNGHGTHVSGTIGAIGDNDRGVVGVNWTASIMASKFLDANGLGTTADAINAIEFVIQAAAATGANVRVLSNSWSSGGFSQALLDEINHAGANDMLFVASAGNNTSDNDTIARFPANYGAAPYNAPNVIAVASSKNTDTLASDSNYGASTVHLAAPGVLIVSTVPFDVYGVEYQYLSGTSMAVPHVAGAAALVLSRCALNTAALKSNLLSNVDPIASLAGRLITGGRLNVNAAIRSCDAAPTPDFSLSASPSTQTVPAGSGTPVNYRVDATPSGGFAGTITFSVSGLPSGASATFSPSSVTTSGSSTMTVTPSPSTPAGTFPLTITGTSGASTRTASVTFVQASIAPAAVDQIVFSDGTGTRTTPPFNTSAAQETLIAFAASDGPLSGGQTLTVTGAGLTWTLVKRVNDKAGTAEIWQASTTVLLSNVTVQATQLFGGFDQSLTVVTFAGAGGTGAAAGASAASGAPGVSLTTTRPGSLVYAVGNDWDSATARTVSNGQTIVHEWVDTRVGDTFWTQTPTAAVSAAGTVVDLSDAAPDTDRWNFAAVEILPADSAGALSQPSTVPNVVNLSQADATSAIIHAGLAVGALTTASSTTVPAGAIIGQHPAAGTSVPSGTAVDLVVSSGPPLVAVPNVVNQTLPAAAAAIINAGLAVGAVTTASSTTVPAGAIISQTPSAGAQVALGSAVALIVSSGPPSPPPPPPPPPPDVVVDRVASSDGRGTRTTSVSTSGPSEMLIAFATSDGVSTGGQTLTISGAGLTWTLVRRASTQSGTAEIWQATAAAQLSNATVTCTQTQGGFDQSLTVVAFRGASAIGASVAGGAPGGAASLTLTTTRANALVYGVGNDWKEAIPRSLIAGQMMVHQWVDSAVGDTFWVQASAGVIPNAGTTVQMGTTGPTQDRWNFALVEIVP